MNNEIKEILDFKENADYKRLSCDEIVILKDYITNLQEENEKVHKDFAELSERYFFTKSRCEKAIEYIKSNEWAKDYEISNCRTHLLNILNGDDKSE